MSVQTMRNQIRNQVKLAVEVVFVEVENLEILKLAELRRDSTCEVPQTSTATMEITITGHGLELCR